MRASTAVFGVSVVAVVLASVATASQTIAYNASEVRLQADSTAALVTFRANGARGQILAAEAVDALPPTPGRAQVAFSLSRGGHVADRCGPYAGPLLPWLVVACTASDGSHWALQTWQRRLPNYGGTPTADRAVWELRLSHWSGPIAVLEIELDWAYRRFDHLFGRLTYRGRPVYGFRATPTGVPLDDFGRNIYVDTLDSTYGGGWRRENSFLAHNPGGVFCYGFFPHGSRPQGRGRRYRATVIGPGVTPDVMWEGPSPGPYNAARDLVATARQRTLFAGDRLCRPR